MLIPSLEGTPLGLLPLSEGGEGVRHQDRWQACNCSSSSTQLRLGFVWASCERPRRARAPAIGLSLGPAEVAVLAVLRSHKFWSHTQALIAGPECGACLP